MEDKRRRGKDVMLNKPPASDVYVVKCELYISKHQQLFRVINHL